MQLQQSSQQQINSKLASPSTSTDDKNARLSQDYDHNTNSKHNGGSHASNGELEVLNEVENENDIKIPGIWRKYLNYVVNFFIYYLFG
jgi:hypothetical protein